jgi:hypothetical protein
LLLEDGDRLCYWKMETAVCYWKLETVVCYWKMETAVCYLKMETAVCYTNQETAVSSENFAPTYQQHGVTYRKTISENNKYHNK